MSPPLVSVVTPFYNTARYLRECIESVLAQTLADYEYVLVDNHSSDGSGEIAREYACRDSRLRLLRTPEHFPQLANYNFALSSISPNSTFCKIVQADDWIFPECLERMVAVGERHSSAGIISSYRLVGDRVRGDGLPVEKELFTGREVCRAQLLQGEFVMGSPTTVVYRSEVVRERVPFFDVSALHADTEAGYEILQTYDFGFVHQVLSYSRLDPESISGSVRDFHPHLLDKLIVVKRYGPAYLSQDEYDRVWSGLSRTYWRSLGRRALRGGGAEFWRYHDAGLARIGERIDRARIVRHAAGALADMALHPRETFAALARRGTR